MYYYDDAPSERSLRRDRERQEEEREERERAHREHLDDIVRTASPGLLLILAEGISADEIHGLEQVDLDRVAQHAGTYTHDGETWLVGWLRVQGPDPDWDDLVLSRLS
jgi:hypothetical protein